MVHAIMCESKVITGLVDAAIDMLGGIGADYAHGPKCAASTPLPFLKLHGIEDPFITYSKDILVDGVNFASSIEGTQLHARHNGCGPEDCGKKDVAEADGKMVCTDYCGAAAGKLPAKLCGMPGVGHDTDHPHPGFVYEQSWAWFQEQVKAAGERKAAAAAAKKASAVAPAKNATTTATGPMVLSITYPGAYVRMLSVGVSSPSVVAAALLLLIVVTITPAGFKQKNACRFQGVKGFCSQTAVQESNFLLLYCIIVPLLWLLIPPCYPVWLHVC